MTAACLAVGLFMLCMSGSTAFFYQESRRCLLDVTQPQLDNLTSSMADMTQFYQHFLPRILIPRIPGTPSHDLVRQFIEDQMRELGWSVELDRFNAPTPFGNKTFTNIVATLKPTAARRIVFACHYDSKYFQAHPEFVGATDSAVPCAILLDTAWKMNIYNMQGWNSQRTQDVTPQFIFFDGEEAFVRWSENDSLYGSRHLALKWMTQPDPNDLMAANYLENIETFILLDLIGGSNLKFTDFYRDTSMYFYRLHETEYCLRSRPYILPHRVYYNHMFSYFNQHRSEVQDDHIPFLQKGVPILHLISVPFPSVWHKPIDDLLHLDTAVISEFSTIFRVFFFRLSAGLI